MATQQASAITEANNLIALMKQIQALRPAWNDFITRYNSEGWAAIWQALPTAALNGDGSLGTADGSPNAFHPIDTRIVTTLNKSVSKAQLTNGVVLLQQLQNFMTDAAVTQALYNQSIDDLAT
ncbi:MAG TPA: hypothetical protein VKS79_21090 [Gemmataceae bacterium]|nr:hypothetical protein [Gemmataceae bacterium]